MPNRTRATSPWLVLAVLCAAVVLINLSTTIMNTALPTLVRDLDASTRELLWIVDAFNLAFAALVLAAGSLSDRFGRRRALVLGLAIFAVASAAGAWSGSPGALVAWRAVMGVGAAIIFPTTLSIIANVFPERRRRATAIGLWGASTGVAVALGPIAGGALLERFWWGAAQLATAPVAVATLVLALLLVPESRDPAAPRLDRPGLMLSALALGAFVFGIIEAPERGWLSTATLAVLGLAALLVGLFVAWERRVDQPMLDVRLFANPRFSAASASVTLAFFALFGFIFLITLYFQFLRGYSPLETGIRLLPVALSVAVANLVGVRLGVRLGAKVIVAAGLLLLAGAYLWIAGVDAATPYGEIAGQMVLLGAGMGLTGAPATEAIMGAVPAAKAGVGSAVNDATREVGGTLGVAVIGSVFLSLYRDAFAGLAAPAEALARARESVGAAFEAAERLAASGQGAAAARLAARAEAGFFDGLAAGCLVAAGVSVAGAIAALLFLPAQPRRAAPDVPAAPERAAAA